MWENGIQPNFRLVRIVLIIVTKNTLGASMPLSLMAFKAHTLAGGLTQTSFLEYATPRISESEIGAGHLHSFRGLQRF